MKYAILCLLVLLLLTGCSSAAPSAQSSALAGQTTVALGPASTTAPALPSAKPSPISASATATPATVAYPAHSPAATPMPITPTAKLLGLIPPAEAEQMIAPTAEQAIQALKNRDMVRLAGMAHPQKGVVFSPYGFLQDNDVVLKADHLPGALADPTIRTWGRYDGTGEPIDLTFEGYYSRFVYSHEFAQAEQIGYNRIIGGDYRPEDFAPNSIMVEYHFSGFDPQYKGMDWTSLRLVFEQQEQTWYLVGILHNQWTI